MIVEEKRAGEKLCCGTNIGVGFGCAGSRCMAWRWALVDVVRTTDDKFAPVAEWIEREPSTTHGYCGLAGRP